MAGRAVISLPKLSLECDITRLRRDSGGDWMNGGAGRAIRFTSTICSMMSSSFVTGASEECLFVVGAVCARLADGRVEETRSRGTIESRACAFRISNM